MIKEQITKKTQGYFLNAVCLGIALLAANGEINAADNIDEQVALAKADREYTFSEVVTESVAGDVYADPSKWQDLSYSNMFSEGWDKPWASPPAGGGGAPRQGWLNAYEGVFYRLGISVFGWQHDLAGAADGYSGSLTVFTPLNQRFEVQTDIPMAVSNRRPNDEARETNFGDFQIIPRFILSESRDVTQTFNITFRTPTGVSENLGQNIAAVTPNYQFWANWWQGFVVRGGAGFFIPYAGDLNRSGARSTFNANLAAGYYFTPHDFTPIGDMVWYLSTNLNQTIATTAARAGLW